MKFHSVGEVVGRIHHLATLHRNRDRHRLVEGQRLGSSAQTAKKERAK